MSGGAVLPGALDRARRGAVAGVAATAAMSALMLPADRLGLMSEAPPRLIVRRFAPRLPSGDADAAAATSHVLYGAAAGALLAAAVPRRRWSAASGALLGLVIWAAAYEGWVPVARVMRPAHRDSPGRVATMIAAHLVYGSVLGRLLDERGRS